MSQKQQTPDPQWIQRLRSAIRLEEQEEHKRLHAESSQGLQLLKSEGLAIHPIRVSNRSFGFADYPEFNFYIPFPAETNRFRDGCSIQLWHSGQEPVKGVLLQLDGRKGAIRLFAPDYPDWMEDPGCAILLAPDDRTLQYMQEALKKLEEHPHTKAVFNQMHGIGTFEASGPMDEWQKQTPLEGFNESQQYAIQQIMYHDGLCIVHGPPGTGKTTTLCRAVAELVREGKKVLFATPSNAAADHAVRLLSKHELAVFRAGNAGKVGDDIFPFTLEGHLSDQKIKKELKELHIRAEAFRKMAYKYKRSFGKAEREQRDLLFKEVRSIRQEIKKRLQYEEERLITSARVIIGTPVALADLRFLPASYDTLIIDEAGQCSIPLAALIFTLAKRWVLAGDPFQLPPTVLSDEAAQMGLAISVLEQACLFHPNHCFLDTQYRMHESIAGFSSAWFYDGRLKSIRNEAPEKRIRFIDTAGFLANEERESQGNSLFNRTELELLEQVLQQEEKRSWVLISPYAGQCTMAKEKFPHLRVSTIDSFQGQEAEGILLTLVRSNEEGQIGFLKDYRRMNVAITRAKERLIIVGDGATLGSDSFYRQLLSYIEAYGEYQSAWEFESL